MKRILLLSVFLSFCLLALPQQKLEVEVGVKNMSKGSQMAISIFIPEARLKDIEDDWKKYINNRSFSERIGNLASQVGNIFKSEPNRNNLKVVKNGDEYYVRSIEEGKITKHSIDIYSRITEQIDGCYLSAFFQFTDSVFISESNVDAERISTLKSYIRDFGVDAYKYVVDNQIREAKKEVDLQESVLKGIKSDTRKEEKAISGYEVDIQEYEATITEVENDIKQLDQTISSKRAEFAHLKKGTPEYNTSKGELKELSREKSKNFRSIKSAKGKIKDKQSDIKTSKSKIEANDLKVTKQQTVINEKEQIVDQLIKKKEGIK